MGDALKYATRERARFQSELFDFLRIPSVSAKSEHDVDTRRAATWLAEASKARVGAGAGSGTGSGAGSGSGS